MLEVPIEGVQDEAEGDFCPDAPGGTIRTARSTAVCHTLGILMPSRNQIQPDPAAQHTHDCLLGCRERVQRGRVWQFLGAYNRSNHVGCLAVAGSLTSHTVWSRQVVNTGDGHRARQHVCPAGSPGTAGSFAGVRSCDAAVLWFTFLCTV